MFGGKGRKERKKRLMALLLAGAMILSELNQPHLCAAVKQLWSRKRNLWKQS